MSLQTDIRYLGLNPKNRLEIFDVETEGLIEKSISKKEVLEEYGSFDDYLKSLMDNGYKKIAIQKAYKKGGGQIREGLLQKYALGDGQDGQLVAERGTGHAAPSAPNPPAMNGGLSNPMGISSMDVMKMNTKAERFDDEKKRAERLEKRVDQLDKENRELDRKVLTYEMGLKNQPKTLDKIMEAVKENPEMVPDVLEKVLNARNNKPALAKPNEQQSKVKAALIRALENPQVTDQVALRAYHLLKQYLEQNTAFTTAFEELLQQQQLKNTENGTTEHNSGQPDQ